MNTFYHRVGPVYKASVQIVRGYQGKRENTIIVVILKVSAHFQARKHYFAGLLLMVLHRYAGALTMCYK